MAVIGTEALNEPAKNHELVNDLKKIFIQPLENNFLANARLIEKISELADF